MPQDVRDKKHDFLRMTIKKQLIVCGYDIQQLAAMLHIVPSSVYNKMKNPDTFTYREIQIVFFKLKFTQEEQLKVI